MKQFKTIFLCLLFFALFPINVIAQTNTDDGIIYIDQDKIVQAYNNYIGPMNNSAMNPLSVNKDDAYANSRLTEAGYAKCLNMINFYRAVCGSDPVTLNDEFNHYAQAGVDFLERNGIGIDHQAASGSDDKDADKGLSSSNLSSESDVINSIGSFFSDTGNMSGRNTGHRDWLIRANQTEMGIGSSGRGSALYVFGPTKQMKMPVISYPAAGISPIELVPSYGVSLWSIDFGSYYTMPQDLNNLKVSVTDGDGNVHEFHYSEDTSSNDEWFSKGFIGNSINLNPYQILGGNAKNGADRTYTISISGFTSDLKSMSYQTTFKYLNELLCRTQPIYRLYNTRTLEHLYTPDANEVSVLTSPGNEWNNEGVAWTAPLWGTAVYRLCNEATGTHLYTTDENEVDTLFHEYFWSIDNSLAPLFYSAGMKPIYRLYNPQIGLHLLTKDENEYNALGASGWNQEGIKAYAFSD